MAIEIAGGTRIDESADDGSSTIRPNAAGAVDAVGTVDRATVAIHRGMVDRPLADDGGSIRPNAAGAVDAVDARGSLSWVRQGESDQGGECGGLDHRAKSILGPLNTRGRFLWSGRAAATLSNDVRATQHSL
jgi:hypothetical protein